MINTKEELCSCGEAPPMPGISTCKACYYGEASNTIQTYANIIETVTPIFYEPTSDQICTSLFPPKPISDKEILDSLAAQGVIKTPYWVCVDATKSTLKQDAVMLFNLALAAIFVPLSKLTQRELRF